MDQVLLTDRDVAQMLRIGKSTVWALLKTDKIPSPIKLGGATRWRKDEIEAHIASLQSKVATTLT